MRIFQPNYEIKSILRIFSLKNQTLGSVDRHGQLQHTGHLLSGLCCVRIYGTFVVDMSYTKTDRHEFDEPISK